MVLRGVLAGAGRVFTGANTLIGLPFGAVARTLYSSPRPRSLQGQTSARSGGAQMFGRIANLFRGFMSLFISGVEKRNPEALLELEQENLRKQVGNFNQGLAAHAGLCERLMGQIRKIEYEEKEIRVKVKDHIRARNRTFTGQYTS